MGSFLEVKETDIWVTNFFLDLSGSNNHVNCAMLFPESTLDFIQYELIIFNNAITQNLPRDTEKGDTSPIVTQR